MPKVCLLFFLSKIKLNNKFNKIFIYKIGAPRFFGPMGGGPPPHMMRSPYPTTISGRPMQSNSPNVHSSNGSPDIVLQPGINFDQRIRQLGPHAIFR